MIVEFLEAANAEYREAIDYYNHERPNLGEDFAAEIRRTLRRIMAFPAEWPRLSLRTRRCQTKRFPYGVIPFTDRIWTVGPALVAVPRLPTSGSPTRVQKRAVNGVIYQQRGDMILVVAVMHLKRDPGYWRERI